MERIIFCITGLSGTGKSTVCNIINNKKKLKKILQCTTRPKRENEIHGKDYNFVKEDDFAIKVAVGDITCLELYKVANGDIWMYGYMKKDLYNGCIMALNPTSIEQLKQDGYKVVSINLYIPEYIRIYRILKRKDNQGIKEIIRRSKQDKLEFKKYKFDYKVKNRNLDKTVDSILDIISKELTTIINHKGIIAE